MTPGGDAPLFLPECGADAPNGRGTMGRWAARGSLSFGGGEGGSPAGGDGVAGPRAGTGVCAALRRGKAPPIFFGLAKENGPRPVQKKNAFVSKSCPLGRFGQERGSCETARWKLGELVPGALGPWGTERVLPRIWGIGWGFRGGYRMAPASFSALPASLSAGRFKVGRAAAAGRRKSNRFCTPTLQFLVAGYTPTSFSKVVPAPNAGAYFNHQCLLLGPHVLSK